LVSSLLNFDREEFRLPLSRQILRCSVGNREQPRANIVVIEPANPGERLSPYHICAFFCVIPVAESPVKELLEVSVKKVIEFCKRGIFTASGAFDELKIRLHRSIPKDARAEWRSDNWG
jgi:hypothetical protein